MAKPTKYRKEHCEALINHMKEGLSFHAFAGRLLVSPRVLFDWVEKHPEFHEAKLIGEMVGLLFWEKTGIAGTHGKIKGFQQASFIFNMKARFAKYGWRDTPPDETDKINNTDRTELAQRLIGRLTDAIRDEQCSNLNPSQSLSSQASSSLGLLGESKNPD